jgi:hypothetical protein
MTHRACASNVASINSNEFISLLTFIPQMKRMNRIENVAQISLKFEIFSNMLIEFYKI